MHAFPCMAIESLQHDLGGNMPATLPVATSMLRNVDRLNHLGFRACEAQVKLVTIFATTPPSTAAVEGIAGLIACNFAMFRIADRATVNRAATFTELHDAAIRSDKLQLHNIPRPTRASC